MDTTLIKDITEAMGINTKGAAEVASEGEDAMVSNGNLVYQGNDVSKGISVKRNVRLLSLKPKAVVKKQKTSACMTVLSLSATKTKKACAANFRALCWKFYNKTITYSEKRRLFYVNQVKTKI